VGDGTAAAKKKPPKPQKPTRARQRPVKHREKTRTGGKKKEKGGKKKKKKEKKKRVKKKKKIKPVRKNVRRGWIGGRTLPEHEGGKAEGQGFGEQSLMKKEA